MTPAPRLPFRELDDAQLARVLHRGGRPLNLFRVLAHHPALLEGVTGLGGVFIRGLLPGADRELVILRMSWSIGCAYEFRQHLVLSRRLGLDAADLEAVATGARDGTPHQRALIGAVDDLAASDSVSESAWLALRERHSEAEVLEVLALAGFYRMLAGILNGVRVPVEDDLAALEPRAGED